MERERILSLALTRGGLAAELFEERTRSTSVVFEDGCVETASENLSRGAGLTLEHDAGLLNWHTTDPDEGTLQDMARGLAENIPTGATPAGVDLSPEPRRAATRVVEDFSDVPLADKVAMAGRIDRAARGSDPRVRQVRILYRDHSRTIRVAGSDNRNAEELQKGFVLAVNVVASSGELLQTGFHSVGGACGWELFRETSPEEVGVEAARRAMMMLEAMRAPGGLMPVVLAASAGGTMIHEAVGHGLEGDLVDEGHSVYRGKVGDMIASPLITVMDDPTLAGRRGSYVFDDEGTPASPTVLIEGGQLMGFMHSRRSARRFGVDSTGNGRRQSYGHPAIPRMSNTFIVSGHEEPEAILRDTPEGLYVTRMGGGQVNTVSGDFVFEVTEGYRIESGRIGEPVRGATLTGNGPEVMCAIDRVGSDLGFSLGTCGKDGQGAPVADAQPTLRIPSLVVGGSVD